MWPLHPSQPPRGPDLLLRVGSVGDALSPLPGLAARQPPASTHARCAPASPGHTCSQLPPCAQDSETKRRKLGRQAAKKQDPVCWVLGEAPLPSPYSPRTLISCPPAQLSLLSRAPLRRTTQEADLTTSPSTTLFILSHEAVAILRFSVYCLPGQKGQGGGTPALFLYLFYLFIWLCQVLLVAHCIFSLQHMGSSSLTRGQTQAPYVGRTEF